MSSTILYPARVAPLPLHPLLIPIPLTCFVGTLLTDIAYSRTAEMMWADFSAWMVSAGVVLGYLALIAGIIDLAGRRFAGTRGAIWIYVIGNILALVVATFDMLIHTRDAWTSVVPWGLGLSAVTSVVLALTVLFGWLRLFRPDAEAVR
jgi:uncharacterized membrane protein